MSVIEDYNRLLAEKEAEIERLRGIEREWLEANSPGGWIDNMRCELVQLRGENDLIARRIREALGGVR